MKNGYFTIIYSEWNDAYNLSFTIGNLTYGHKEEKLFDFLFQGYDRLKDIVGKSADYFDDDYGFILTKHCDDCYTLTIHELNNSFWLGLNDEFFINLSKVYNHLIETRKTENVKYAQCDL